MFLIAAGAAHAIAATSESAAAAQPTDPPGFSSPNDNPFTAILQLVPAGPNRAARAVAVFDRQFAFQRLIWFHQELGKPLEQLLDQLPPRQSTLIRAAGLYSNSEIPWIDGTGGVHAICVTGTPRKTDYYYALAPECSPPDLPAQFSGRFALTPVATSGGGIPNVTGQLSGQVTIDTFGLVGAIDGAAAVLPFLWGDLKPPWDKQAGEFNQHDIAGLARWHRDMPHFSAAADRYIKFSNVLDEFDSPAGPIVLFNLDGTIREAALAKFPHLKKFYDEFTDSLTAQSAIEDANGDYWLRASFDRGRVRVIFMNRGGLLVPFDDNFKPAGEAIAPGLLSSGSYKTLASVQVRSLGMDFGLGNLNFTTDYTRAGDNVQFKTRMNSPPELVAPPVIHGMIDLIAGEFLSTLAQGNGGMHAFLESNRTPAGNYHFAGGWTAELAYSPTLEFLAKVGDSL
ncbi:MAG TPA: hypothetical protein VMT58_01485, partial [Candidatus Binataceae bacterium]|nr:hypothetical protein [Candidatus Binataceae bacterium]